MMGPGNGRNGLKVGYRDEEKKGISQVGKWPHSTMIVLVNMSLLTFWAFTVFILNENMLVSQTNLDRLVNFLSSVCRAWESKRAGGWTLGQISGGWTWEALLYLKNNLKQWNRVVLWLLNMIDLLLTLSFKFLSFV